MQKDVTKISAEDYRRMATAIQFLRDHVTDQPQLDEVAAAVGISASHCQRLFRRYSGVSPKRFLQYLTVNQAKILLRQTASVMEVSLESGLSGPSRLHDHFVSLEAMTPGEYRLQGRGLTIRYGACETGFGDIFLAETDRGICRLVFLDNEPMPSALDQLKGEWPQAHYEEDCAAISKTIQRVFGAGDNRKPLTLFVQGTNFQIKVWEALLTIPYGTATSYGKLARMIGQPRAVRASASAVGANPIAVLIPCHRVLRSNGGLGGYRWGLSRKQLLLACERE